MSTNPQSHRESPAKIFISYRREDTQQIAGRLFDRLADTFGEELVLKDVDSIPYGVDFRDYSTRLVQESRIVLVLIGPQWLQRQANGARRIDDEADLVRLEIEASLRHCAAVIPVLVGEAEAPKAADLPASIASLAYRNAARLRHDPDFRVDSDRLIRRLREIFAEPVPIVVRTATVGVAQDSLTSSASASASSSIASKPKGEEATTPEALGIIASKALPEARLAVVHEPSSSVSSVASLQAQALASEVPETTAAGGGSPPANNVFTMLRRTEVANLAPVALALCLIGSVAIFGAPYLASLTEEPAPKIASGADEGATPEPDDDASSNLPTSDHGSDAAESTAPPPTFEDIAETLSPGHTSDAAGSVAYPPRYENIAEIMSLDVTSLQKPGAGTCAGEVQALGDPPIEFCWCPAGSFKMGSPADDPAADDYEKPQVDVTLTNGFWIGKTEVTRGQWTAVMGTAPWTTLSGDPGPESDDVAATYISWEQAQEFCDILSSRERGQWRLFGWRYALPTEAQWEYACRAGTTTRYSFEGEDVGLTEYAWVGEAVSGTYPHPVGRKRANPWGLLDMHGNVEEWCRDMSDRLIHALPGGVDPYHSEGATHIVRGGSWADHPLNAISAQRAQSGVNGPSRFVGLRMVCVPAE